ncbi:FusB/FusC family EF-G-binding protein [Paenibacillus sp. GSMTC-2017]|uniref:FusB/FusC family EF-G-binding protein n=1 Tax=Paenibacillus sp. GSMTC-2017 TaxID=2794350 RepID=UPI0018D776F3|nr:FusB/FusC family EF-G-binding protein [Paenibacillus sp. GSMTC-2017]MBH5320476.1 FusB/FusC family EF-G-binding protein [Paenibacillus sp. GSMTC-2017]
MTNPFIRNHQYNVIKKQANQLQIACNTVSDRKVVEALRQSVLFRILEAFEFATEIQKQLLEKVSTLNTAGEFQQYLQSLEPYITEFVQVTEPQLKKLFPKVKKLKVPHLATIDYRYITYMGWHDIATDKMFLVYHLDGQLIGIEGRFNRVNKKSVCFVCNRHAEVALFSAVAKSKPANASSDYYKAIGNYLCVDSDNCNKNIMDVGSLEAFFHAVTGKRHT